MSAFHGKQGKGAMRAHRATKTREAVERGATSSHASMGRRAAEGTLDPRDYLALNSPNGFEVVRRIPAAVTR